MLDWCEECGCGTGHSSDCSQKVFVYVLVQGYSEPDRVFIENITATLNEWASMWPNDIFFVSDSIL